MVKNLKFKMAKGNPRLGTVWRMIWGVIRLIAVKILVSVVGRTRARRVQRGSYCKALVD